MKDKITQCAQKYDADVITFTRASDFPEDDAIFKIFPQVKTVVALGFRVLRGSFRGIEEGTVFYQYTTMGVENLEETVMPFAQLAVASAIEAEGYIALPQRRHQDIMNDESSTNPELWYENISRGIKLETQMNFEQAAQICSIGEIGLSGKILNPEYGPFIRYCFILTDLELEPTPKGEFNLCDRCGECIKACPGGAISNDGGLDKWQCAVYYSGARGEKNPFMAPDAYINLADRDKIIDGSFRADANNAPEVLDNSHFYPGARHYYNTSICGRACDRACYVHLEEKGVLKKKFKKKFRTKEEWKLDTKQFKTLRCEKEWDFTK